MAKPDSRLVELTSALTGAGLDWLALEVLQGVQEGLLTEEGVDEVHRAQTSVRYGEPPRPAEDLRAFVPVAVNHLDGGEQLRWAKEYVVNRLTDAAEMLDASLLQLNGIAASDESLDATGRAVSRAAPLEVQVGEDGPIMSEFDMRRTRELLLELANALDTWARADLA
jgi:hypothetical protein